MYRMDFWLKQWNFDILNMKILNNVGEIGSPNHCYFINFNLKFLDTLRFFLGCHEHNIKKFVSSSKTHLHVKYVNKPCCHQLLKI